MAIPTRALGRTGTEVSVLGYGAMELRGQPRGPAVEDADAERLLNGLLDAGINLIDTSIDYGRSEELIGRFLSARRDEYFDAARLQRRKCSRRRRAEPAAPADGPPRPRADPYVAKPG
jgi:aryl-alcohol dehydrogenase-like predicted oxidoreductase